MPIHFLLKAVFGFVLTASLATLFKPLLIGTFRALKLAVMPSMSKEQRLARAYYRDAMILHSLASSKDALSPNLVAELRALSGRS